MSGCDAMMVAAVDRTTSPRVQAAGWDQREEGIVGRRRAAQHQRALAEVAEHQRGQDQARARPRRMARAPKCPMSAYSASPPVTASTTEPSTRVPRRRGRQERSACTGHSAASTCGCDTGRARPAAPMVRNQSSHHRTEEPAHGAGAPALEREQAHQDAACERAPPAAPGGAVDLQTLHRAEHRDGGRDHAVAIEQRGAKHHQQRPATEVPHRRRAQRREPAPAARRCRPRRGCRRA